MLSEGKINLVYGLLDEASGYFDGSDVCTDIC